MKKILTLLLTTFICSEMSFAAPATTVPCPKVIAYNGFATTKPSGIKCYNSIKNAKKAGFTQGTVCLGSGCATTTVTLSGSGTGGDTQPFGVVKYATITLQNSTDLDCKVDVMNYGTNTDADATFMDVDPSSTTTSTFNKAGTYYLHIRGCGTGSWNITVNAH